MSKLILEAKVLALREQMAGMTITESTTRQAKYLALKVRRIEKLINKMMHNQSTIEPQ